MSEEALTNNLIRRINQDFYILREVKGVHPIDQQGVRIDLMLKAKSHLIDAGFVDEWFGIECKWADKVIGSTSKTTRMVWQSITYAQSVFIIDGKRIRPAFVAVYTPDNLDKSIESHLETLLALGLYGNVGRFYFYKTGEWAIKFAYNYAKRGQEINISSRLLPKRRVGSV